MTDFNAIATAAVRSISIVWAPAHNNGVFGYTEFNSLGESEFIPCAEEHTNDTAAWLRRKKESLEAEGLGEFVVNHNTVVKVEIMEAAKFSVDEKGRVLAHIVVNNPQTGMYGGMSLYVN